MPQMPVITKLYNQLSIADSVGQYNYCCYIIYVILKTTLTYDNNNISNKCNNGHLSLYASLSLIR